MPAAGLAMGPSPTYLLVLVLCLGQAVHTQEGIGALSSPLPSHVPHMGFQDPQYKASGTGCEEGTECKVHRGVLPKPSIRAEPGPVICWGQPVTIVCRAPVWADTFRLEDKNGRPVLPDQTNVSQRGPHWAEATFHIEAVSDKTAGSYRCLYCKGPSWSERSDILELKVTDEDIFPPPSGAPRVVTSTALTPTKPPSTAESSTSRAALGGTGLTTDHIYILVGVCAASLLGLLLLALLLVHRQHQKKRGPLSSKGEEPRPQERLSPTADITESPADVATTVEALVDEENRDMHSPSPAAGDPQEVTYAELDQRALTRRAARAESPQCMEPTAESSMYAALPRH